MKWNAFSYMKNSYIALVLLFLHIPISILVLFSFNDSKINAVWVGFTLTWYEKLFSNTSVLAALENTLVIACASTIISTMIGTLTAVGMYKYHFRGKTAIDALLYIPIVIPEIVLGIAMLAFFALIKIPLGMLTLILAHITFCISFVVIVVQARLEGFDHSLEEAAMDLGANHWQTFIHVTLPLIMPGIIAGALLSLTLSLDDVIISFFVSGPSSTTLPLLVFSMVRSGVTPEINALSTLMLVAVIPIVVIAELLRRKQIN